MLISHELIYNFLYKEFNLYLELRIESKVIVYYPFGKDYEDYFRIHVTSGSNVFILDWSFGHSGRTMHLSSLHVLSVEVQSILCEYGTYLNDDFYQRLCNASNS